MHLDELLREISRVLKPGGIAIHVLPTPSWRFWTSLSHYPYYAKLILVRLSARIRRPDVALNGSARKLGDTIKDMGFWPMLWQILVDGPHGEYPSALSELWYFSRVRWLALFKQNGCRVRSYKTTGLFYTGYAVLPLLAIPIRTIMAKVLGSATCIYVIEKD